MGAHKLQGLTRSAAMSLFLAGGACNDGSKLALDVVPPRPRISVAAANAFVSDCRGLMHCSTDEEDDFFDSDSTFEITVVRKSKGKWGLKLDCTTEGCVQVVQVGPGAVEAYNAAAVAERRVLKHDLLTRVNGHTQAADIERAIAPTADFE